MGINYEIIKSSNNKNIPDDLPEFSVDVEERVVSEDDGLRLGEVEHSLWYLVLLQAQHAQRLTHLSIPHVMMGLLIEFRGSVYTRQSVLFTCTCS